MSILSIEHRWTGIPTGPAASERGCARRCPISDPIGAEVGNVAIPETMLGLLEMLLEDSLAALPRAGGKAHARLAITIREIELVLCEMRDPRDDGHRPIYPRVVRILARLTEDGLL